MLSLWLAIDDGTEISTCQRWAQEENSERAPPHHAVATTAAPAPAKAHPGPLTWWGCQSLAAHPIFIHPHPGQPCSTIQTLCMFLSSSPQSPSIPFVSPAKVLLITTNFQLPSSIQSLFSATALLPSQLHAMPSADSQLCHAWVFQSNLSSSFPDALNLFSYCNSSKKQNILLGALIKLSPNKSSPSFLSLFELPTVIWMMPQLSKI